MDIYTITINNEVEVTYDSLEKCFNYLAKRFNDCIVFQARKNRAVSLESLTQEIEQYMDSRIHVKTGMTKTDKMVIVYRTKLN